MVPTYTVNEIRNCVNFAFRVLETENNGMIRVNFVAAEHIVNHNPFLITQRSYPMQSPVLSSGPRSTRSCGGGEAELARGLKRVKENLNIFFLISVVIIVLCYREWPQEKPCRGLQSH